MPPSVRDLSGQVPTITHEPIRHFDAEKRTFTFEVIADGFPFFVKSLHSTWTVQALGAKRSEVTIHSQFEMLPVIGALMWPLFKKNTRETTTTLLEELKHYAETGETGRLTHQAKDPGQLG